MLTLMTQNLNFYGDKHGPWSRRRELIRAAIAENEPDIVALQAVCSDPAIEEGTDQATQLSRLLPDYRYVFFYPAHIADTGREEGSAILSRLPIREPGVRELSLREGTGDGSRRVIQHARFELDEQDLNVFNAYFSWVEEQAQDNIAEALAFLARAEGPTLLMGDFNVPAGSPLLRALETAGYTDLWQVAHPDETGYTFEADHPDRRIDYVWADATLARRLGAVQIIRHDEDGARLSDHLGLKVDLKLRTTAFRPPPEYRDSSRTGAAR